ncbi:VOC family protein [Streptomyces sp. NPDC086023]|uniref:VOC family protein n=1 Tax=Streptomyces sp. NPDC086023 TaxID=3365746 RepID=UPI0037D8F670
MGVTVVPTSSEDVFGAPCWVSLTARDLEAAQHFYGAVLGWHFRPGRLGDAFSVAFVNGAPVAGIGALADSFAVSVAWIPYFAVADADATAAKIRERSATVAVGPLSFGLGRAALAADRDGAIFGIWQGRVIRDWAVGRSRAPACLELYTRDAFAAAIFYAEVLDWASGREGCCEVSYESDHVVLRHGTGTVARIRGGAVDEAPDPQVRPRWHVHFRVPDLSRAIDTATLLGGTAVTPVRADGTHNWITLRDPEGALFTVTAPLPADLAGAPVAAAGAGSPAGPLD